MSDFLEKFVSNYASRDKIDFENRHKTAMITALDNVKGIGEKRKSEVLDKYREAMEDEI